MSTWKVNLKFSDGVEREIELFDTKKYFNGYLKIKRSYFNRLIKAIKMTKKYTTTHAIEKVISPDKSFSLFIKSQKGFCFSLSIADINIQAFKVQSSLSGLITFSIAWVVTYFFVILMAFIKRLK